MDTIVEVTNLGNAPFTLRFGGGVYPIPADENRRTAVPVGAVKRSFGNWEAFDQPERNYTPRTREINRLSTLYGLAGDPLYSDDLEATTAAGAEEHDQRDRPIAPERPYNPVSLIDGRKAAMHPNLPRFAVYDLDGNRIFTVLDDPDNTIANGRIDRKVRGDSEKALRSQVNEMQRTMQQMIDQLAKVNPTAAAELATSTRHPNRADMPSLHDDTEDASDEAADPIASADAMDVMNEELGLSGAEDPDDEEKPRPVKKAAAKKAAARRGDG